MMKSLKFSFGFFVSIFFTLQIARASSYQDVYVGVYLNDVINVDIKANTYVADFYLWFRWQGESDPSDSFEFVNAFSTWSHTKQKLYAIPKMLEGGWKYQVLHINGDFHYPFFLSHYPLDEQKLVISIEDSIRTKDGIRYVADTNYSSYRKDISIPGWQILKQSISALPFKYETHFGEPKSTENYEEYWRLNYVVEIARNKKLYLFKMLLPIIVVLLCTLAIFFINPIYSDSRLALAITALVSAVAMHITVSADLPTVGYLVLIDKIYNLSYIAIFCALAETVFTIYLKDRAQFTLAKKIDRYTFAIVSVSFLISCFAVIHYR